MAKAKIKDDQERIREVLGWFKEAYLATEIYRKNVLEDYRFVEGDQWEEADKNRLAEQGRPALTWNQILPIINLITGVMQNQSLDPRAFPRGSEDEALGRIMTSLMRYVLEINHAGYELQTMFDDGVIGGMGWLEILPDFEFSDDPTGEIRIQRIRPLAMFWDPSAQRYDKQDAAYLIKATWMSRKRAERIWPEHKEAFKGGEWLRGIAAGVSGVLAGTPEWLRRQMLDVSQDKVRILSVWHKEPISRHLAINTNTGSSLEFETGREAEAFLKQIRAAEGKEAAAAWEVIERKNFRTHLTIMTAWHILEEGPSRLGHELYPYVPFSVYQFNDDIFGLIRNLKDPQREINKRHSQMLHIVNTTANSGWLVPKGSIRDLNTLKNMGSMPGVVIEYNAQRPTKIEPSGLPSAFAELAAFGLRAIREISGVNAELVGQTTQVTVSGRAIEARQRGGLVILQRLMENFSITKRQMGRILVKTIQHLYPPEKMLKIIGRQRAIGDQGVMGLQGEAFTDEATLLAMTLPRIKNIDFDVVVELVSPTASARQAQFQEAIQLAQMGIPVPPELLIELSDIPHKEELRRQLEAKGTQPVSPEAFRGAQALLNQIRSTQGGAL